MIRGATKDDLDLINTYIPHLIQASAFGFAFEGYVMDQEVFDYYTQHPRERMMLIFEADNKPVGFVIFDTVIWPFPGRLVKSARIPFVYLDEEHRKQGHMDVAIEALEYWAKKIDADYCTLGTQRKKKGYKKAEVVYIKEIK